MTLLIIPLETYALMARCLKKEASLEEERTLAEMLLSQEDLEIAYEIFRTTFQSQSNIHSEHHDESDLQKRFEKITRRLRDEKLL